MPIATYALRGKERLFNHLVGEREQPIRDGQSERLGGLEIEHQVVLGRLLYWQISRLFAFKNAADIDAAFAVRVR